MFKLCWMKDFYGNVNEYFFDWEQGCVYYLNLADYNKRRLRLTPVAVLLISGPLVTLAQRLLGGIPVAITSAANAVLLLTGAALIHLFYAKSEARKAAYIRENGLQLYRNKAQLLSLFREGRTYRLGLGVFCLLCACMFLGFSSIDGSLLYALMSPVAFCGTVIWLEMLSPVQWFLFKKQLKQME